MITYVSTQELRTEDLTPYPGNARVGNVPKIVESLKTNGQYRSLIVRQTDQGHTILAGNHTWQALKELDRETVRCEVVTCDDETARRVNLVDNRAAELGEYDDTALAELLESFEDLSGTGYDFEDLDDLLATLGREETLPPGPTGAAYSEAPEEEKLRESRISGYQDRHPEGTTELILVLTISEREEVIELVKKIRSAGEDGLTSGQVILAALRAYES